MKMKKYLGLFMFLLLIVSICFGQGSSKRKQAQINEKFRNIANNMQESYDNGNMDKVFSLFYKYCHKNDKMKPKPKPGKKREEFKTVAGEIRADIYRLVALSYDDLEETK